MVLREITEREVVKTDEKILFKRCVKLARNVLVKQGYFTITDKYDIRDKVECHVEIAEDAIDFVIKEKEVAS